MNNLLETLPKATWLDEQAAQVPELEFIEAEKAIANQKEALKTKEAQLLDLAALAKIKAADIEEENQKESAFAAELEKKDLEELSGQSEEDDSALIQQVVIDYSLDMQTVTGGGPGHYYDFNPYHGWGSVYRHNEGGVTSGSAGWNLSARRMYPYAHARGDGVGITDDNDVTTWTKLFFAFWPTRIGHVRAFVPYFTRGYFRIYSNDKWYNSKEAKVDLDISIRLYQNYWGGTVKDDIFYLFNDNINRSGRIDRSGTLYTASLPVGASKWVIAEVAVRAHVETEGGGSTATLDFRNPDYISVPYVRFDFS